MSPSPLVMPPHGVPRVKQVEPRQRSSPSIDALAMASVCSEIVAKPVLASDSFPLSLLALCVEIVDTMLTVEPDLIVLYALASSSTLTHPLLRETCIPTSVLVPTVSLLPLVTRATEFESTVVSLASRAAATKW